MLKELYADPSSILARYSHPSSVPLEIADPALQIPHRLGLRFQMVTFDTRLDRVACVAARQMSQFLSATLGSAITGHKDSLGSFGD